MTLTTRTRKVSAIALAIGVAVVLGGCSGSGSTSAPSSRGATDAPGQSAPASQGTGSGGGGVSGAMAALDGIQSYKFAMTMQGGTWGDMFDKPITGTVVLAPTPAIEISYSAMGIDIGVMQIGDTVYTKTLGIWATSTKDSDRSFVENMMPSRLFGSYFDGELADGYTAAGEEQKNGVAALHYTASADVLSEYGGQLGVEGGTWTAEVWIAKDAGYPVSTKIQNSGGSTDFLLQLDITNVNDPANVVTAP